MQFQNPLSSKARKQRRLKKEEIRRNQSLILAAVYGRLPAGTPGTGYTYINPRFQESKESTEFMADWYDPEKRRKIMSSCAWAYENVAHVWTAFNRIAETTIKAVILKQDAPNTVKEFWKRETRLRSPQLLIKNSLKFGSAIFEPNSKAFKVRDTRDFQWSQNTDGTIQKIHQRRDIFGSFDKEVDRDKVRFFVLHPSFSDDTYGIPAAKPALADIEILRNMIKQGYKAFKNYAAPVIWIQTPAGVTLPDRRDIQDQLKSFSIDTRLVLPPGCEVKSVFEKGQFVYTDLRKMIREQIITAMGIGQVPLGISEGSNRATSREEKAMLYDSIQPAAMLLAVTLSEECDRLFHMGGEPFTVQELSSEDVLRKSEADQRLSLAIWRLQQVIDSPSVTDQIRTAAQQRILALLRMETARSV